jgi:hypothetical protein
MGLILHGGKLYGTTLYGATGFGGVVFELSNTSGTWNYQALYNFQFGNDGNVSPGALLADAAGNLYGVRGVGEARRRRLSIWASVRRAFYSAPPV